MRETWDTAKKPPNFLLENYPDLNITSANNKYAIVL